MEWCVAGVTDSNAVRVQAAVPGVDVYEHCTTYDGRLNCVTSSCIYNNICAVDRMLRWKLQKQFHNFLSYFSATRLMILTSELHKINNYVYNNNNIYYYYYYYYARRW